MTQANFNEAWRDLMLSELPPSTGARELAMEIVRQDQRRVRMLAFLSLLFWLLGAVGMVLLVIALNRFVLYIRIADHPSARSGATTTDPAAYAPDERMLWGTNPIHHALPVVGGGTIAALMLAALSTVLLVLSSRRATLNRINISLVQMSEQLKQLHQTSRGADSRDRGSG